MLRVKGSFRNGRKEGARPNLHNFRSSSNNVKWNDPIADKIVEEAEVIKMPIEAPVKVPPQLRKAKVKKAN